MKSKVRSSFSWFLSILLVLTMMPAMAFTAYATDTITVTWQDQAPYSYVYDGNAHSPTAEVEGGTVTYTYLKSGETEASTVEPTAAGTYTKTAVLPEGDYAFSGSETPSVEFTITPKELTLNWTNTELDYSGEAQGPTVAIAAGQVVNTDTDNVSVSVKDASKKTDTNAKADVASYTAEAELTLTGDAAGNYTLATDTATQAFTIDPATVTLGWKKLVDDASTTTDDISYVYDGAEHAPVAVVTAGTFNEDTCTVTVEEARTNANTTSNPSYTATATGLSNANYKLPTADEDKSREFTITAKPARVVWATGETFTYNGEEQAPTATILAADLATGDSADDITVTVDGAQVEANTNPYTAEATGFDNTNYSLTTDSTHPATTTFTIGKKALTFTPKDQVVNNVDDLINDSSMVMVDGLVSGHALEFTSITLEASDNNTKISIPTLPEFEITNSNSLPVLTANYDPKYNNKGTLTVVSADDASTLTGVVYEYGGNVANGVDNITVTLEKGNKIYGKTTTENGGHFKFTTAEPGVYNVVAKDENNDLIKTEMVTISGATHACEIEMPDEDVNSVLDTSAAGKFAPVVGGLGDAAEEYDTGTGVTLEFTVKSEDSSSLTDEEEQKFEDAMTAIDAFANPTDATSNVTFTAVLDMTLTKDGTDIGANNDQMLQILVPYPTTGKDIAVFRYHQVAGATSPSAEELPELTSSSLPTEEGFTVTNGYVGIHATGFSVYAIGYRVAANNDQPAGGGGGGGGRTSGGIAATTPDTPATTEPTTTEPVVTNPTTGTSTTTFTDVKEGAYYAEAVKWAVAAGITNGKTATLFGPDDSCTRAQIVTFIWRAMGSPEPTVSTTAFTDIDANAYYYKAVLWAVEAGVANGTSATTFSPNATVTRGEAVTFLYRAKGGSLATATSQFTDVDPSAYYAEAVAWAAANGITTGTSATTFSPNEKCTRGQIVTFLYRANN